MKIVITLVFVVVIVTAASFLLSLGRKGARPAAPIPTSTTQIPVVSFTPNPSAPVIPLPSILAEPASPSATPSESPTSSAATQLTRDELIATMPVQTDTFKIEYFQNSDTFIVTITQSPYDQNKAVATQWFADRGFTDLQALRVKFSSYPYVK